MNVIIAMLACVQTIEIGMVQTDWFTLQENS